MQRSACLPSGSAEQPRAARVDEDEVERRTARHPARTPVQSDVYGFIRSPVADRGSSCISTARSRHSSTTFSTPITVTSVSRQRGAHPPVPLRLDDRDRSGLGDGEVRAGHGDARTEKRLAQILPRGCEQRTGSSASPGSPSASRSSSAISGPAAVERRHERVRRPLARQLHDQLGQIRLDRPIPPSRARR